MKTEKWFDVCCDLCGYCVSTDFGKGFAWSSKEAIAWARELGYKDYKGKTVCPCCLKKLQIGLQEEE